MLLERVPQTLLDAFGPEVMALALRQGLNRRTVLLTLTEPQLDNFVLPPMVAEILHAFWCARTGESAAAFHRAVHGS